MSFASGAGDRLFRGTDSEEISNGQASYLNVLTLIHRYLKPKRYLEIGIRHGTSLALARCDAVGVDPEPTLTVTLGDQVKVVEATSDDFFAETLASDAPAFDLIFIDGMHLSEFVLRDFINAEKLCQAGSVIVVDDIFPNHPIQASRERRTATWTGDVWKLVPTLQKWRPDLRMLRLDTDPSGLLLVDGLDPSSRVLEENLDTILQELHAAVEPPGEVIERVGAAAPTPANLRVWLGQEEPDAERAALSVIVVTYDIRLGLERLLQSLCGPIQSAASRVEVIVVDAGYQGSDALAPIQRDFPNVLVGRWRGVLSSLGQAVKVGIELASSDHVAVLADETKVVSPGLLERALAAIRQDPEAVWVAHSLHVVPKRSLSNFRLGYGPGQENRYLAPAAWGTDGAGLFERSVFDPDSAQKWDSLPRQPDFIVMPRLHWERQAITARVSFSNWSDLCRDGAIRIGVIRGEGSFGWIATRNPRLDPEATLPQRVSATPSVTCGQARSMSSESASYHRFVINLRKLAGSLRKG